MFQIILLTVIDLWIEELGGACAAALGSLKVPTDSSHLPLERQHLMILRLCIVPLGRMMY
jgi:hypothetical protein